MDHLDLNRWRALIEARANAEHDGPQVLEQQEAYTAAAQAQADLDRYRARGPTGQADRRSSPADVAADHARSIAELESRVAACRQEADRVAARSKLCAAKRNALAQIVDGIRRWAQAQSLNLPGDDATTITGMPGFAPTTARITSPAREFVP